MRITLSNGAEIQVGCKHGTTQRVHASDGLMFEVRCTDVWIKTAGATKDDAPLLSAKVVCSTLDNFCKRTGRRLAINKLLAQMGRVDSREFRNGSIGTRFSILLCTREDRRAVFAAICPDLAGKKAST